jgi:hypothetical protein
MKRIIFLVIIISFSTQLSACDLCNGYLSMSPFENKHAVGFRYRISGFEGFHVHNNLSDGAHQHTNVQSDLKTKEQFHTYELWTRWYPFSKIQIYTSLPFSDNYKMKDGKVISHLSGFGDFILISQYEILNTFNKAESKYVQKLNAGGGIKLPTGIYNKRINGELNEHLQCGTGSTDWIAITTYTGKFKNIGIDINVTYKINSTNTNEFHFANRLNSGISLFYSAKLKYITVLPQAGIYMESAGMDKKNEIFLNNTGGLFVMATTGFDIYFNKLIFNTAFQLPFYERYNGRQSLNEFRFITGIGYRL